MGWFFSLVPSFVNTALLAGLGAVSVPIIIHLLNRRRFKILHWAAMDFLLEAARMNRKRIQMEHLIVLLLRCIAVALVALAVARPVATRGALAKLPGARDQVERIVVLDDSASTGEKEGDRTAFDEEKRLLKELVDDLARERPGDLVTIIRGSRVHQPDLVRSEAKSGRTEEVARRIDVWLPSDTRFNIEACLREALSSDKAGEKSEKSALKRYVYFLTDFRKTDWLPATPGGLNAVHELMKTAGTETDFFIADAGHEDTTNLGVVELAPQEKLVTTGIAQKLVACVKNYGRTSAHDVRLQLNVGASSLPVTPIPEIKPGETKEVEITYTFAEPGPFAATVRLEGDRLPADDRRDVALEVVRAKRVLLIDGKPSDDPFESQTFFLERALAPPGEIKSGVEAVTIPIERLSDEDLSSYHAIVLCDVDGIPDQRRPAIYRYLREGGGVGIFLGDDVDAAAYENALWKYLPKSKDGKASIPVDGAGLLPCRLGELRQGAQPVALTVPSLDHPLLRIFQGQDNPFLSRVKSRKRFSCPVDPLKDKTTKVIAKWEDVEGTPAILEKPLKAGRVVLFNTSASRAWTDWPREVSFPVTAQELVHHLAPASTQGRNIKVGERIARSINPAIYEPKAKLWVPGEKQPRELLASRRQKARGEEADEDDDGLDALWFVYEETFAAGVYQLELTPRAAGAAPRVESYAVELDPREGELEKADRDVVAKQLEEGVKLKVYNSATDKTSLLAMTEGERRELWRSCAFFLLAVLAAEGILSFIAAHHGSAASQEEVEAARRGRSASDAPVALPVAAGTIAAQDDRPAPLPIAGAK